MIRVFRHLSLLLISTAMLLLAQHRSLDSIPNRQFVTVIRRSSDKTLNWAGYVAALELKKPLAHSVIDVRGTWQVPSVASSGTSNTYSAIWVGLDGVVNRKLEQIGTEQDWYLGAPVYYAWFGMSPQESYYIPSFPVGPGDQIAAEVQPTGNFPPDRFFLLSITNLTQNAGFSIIATNFFGAECKTAEWIVEAPSFHHVLPLADFGSVTFSQCYALIWGTLGPINNVVRQYQALTIEDRKTSTILAQPSEPTPDGTGFTVTWEHN